MLAAIGWLVACRTGRSQTAVHDPASKSNARTGETRVRGRLPPEVIQRIVRLNYPFFRRCYEDALRTDPGLEGKVTVRFVIERDGSVTHLRTIDTTMPNRSVVQCVVQGYYDIKFPKPEAGIVIVVYPIVFSPGDTNDDQGQPDEPIP
jgi:hypothetical protein